MTSLIVGAYPVIGASAEAASACVAALAERDDVGGLEIPYAASGIVVPSGCPDRWRHVVTCIGDTVQRMTADPMVGLASPDREGRASAVRVIADLRDQVEALGSVAAVEIHSGPQRIATATAFAESLAEIGGWDWGDVRLLVEHCDAWRDDRSVEKGFLSLDDELAVLAGLDGRFDMCVNWARSVIETREARTGADHVRTISAAGRLGGVMFSSVSDADSVYGGAWVDAHLPPADSSGGVPSSLLTARLVRETLAAAGDALSGSLVGLKIGVQPADQPTATRVGHLLDAVDLISRNAG